MTEAKLAQMAHEWGALYKASLNPEDAGTAQRCLMRLMAIEILAEAHGWQDVVDYIQEVY
jgi:hypothetical protein